MRIISSAKINHCMVARLLEVKEQGKPYYTVSVSLHNPSDYRSSLSAIVDLEKTFDSQLAAKTYIRQLRREYKVQT